MPLTDQQQQALIIQEFAKTGDSDFTSLVSLLWTQYDNLAAQDPRLRILFVKRDAAQALLSELVTGAIKWEEAGVSEDNTAQLAHLKSLFDLYTGQIAALQGGAAAFVGQLTTVTPLDPCGGFVNPNDRAYRGDPIRRSPWPWSR